MVWYYKFDCVMEITNVILAVTNKNMFYIHSCFKDTHGIYASVD